MVSRSAQVAEIKNLIVISDTHSGCRLALCPPGGIKLDDGGTYLPSDLQLKIWGHWEEFWGNWVPEFCRGEPFAVVHNGDALDGVHHGSTTQISQNIGDQLELAYKIMRPIVERCEGRYYHIRGTEAHVGKSGIYEEQLAKRLGAIPNAEGQFARYELWKRVGSALVHCLHHIGTTGSAAHETSALNAELAAMYVEAARWNEEPPDYVVRSHRHRSSSINVDSAKGFAAVIVTPAWQGKGPFPYKIPGARVSSPQFGGIGIRQGDVEHYYRRKVWPIKRSPVE